MSSNCSHRGLLPVYAVNGHQCESVPRSKQLCSTWHSYSYVTPGAGCGCISENMFGHETQYSITPAFTDSSTQESSGSSSGSDHQRAFPGVLRPLCNILGVAFMHNYSTPPRWHPSAASTPWAPVPVTPKPLPPGPPQHLPS
jgi:hypothetical protein